MRLAIPAYATWTRRASEADSNAAPRRCCFDDVSWHLADRVACLRPLRHLNGTMPLTLTLPHVMLAARKQSKGETEADDATSVEAEQPTLPYCRRFMIRFIDATLRGASQVVIINNPCSGILIICSLFFPSPIIGECTKTSKEAVHMQTQVLTSASRVSPIRRSPRGSRSRGCNCGCLSTAARRARRL